MSKITKRLLSLLVVITMVLSMVPTTGLPAVEVKAAEQTTNAELVLDADGNGYCPACQTTVQWTAYDGTKQYYGATAIADSQHLYLADDTHYTVNSVNMIGLTTSGKLCFHLNGHVLTVDRSAGARIWVNTGAIGLNLFGEGGGICNNNYNTIQHNAGYVNVYGGTYADTGAGNMFATTSSSGGAMMLQDADVGTITYGGLAANVQLKGSTVVDSIQPVVYDTDKVTIRGYGAVTLDETWTGTATVDIPVANLSKLSYSGAAPSGLVTLASGEKLAYANGALVVSEKDVCSECNESVTWEVFDGTKQYTDLATHKHFYLAADTTYTVGSVNMITIAAGGSVCFDLNGKTLTIGNSDGRARMWLQSGAGEGAELNIIANGGAINYSNYSIIQQNNGTVKVIGGTYTSSSIATFISDAVRRVELIDATINNNITSASNAANIVLKGSTALGTIDFTNNDSSLTVDETWTGSATLIPYADAYVDGVLSSKYTYTGTPIGKLTLTTGETLTYENKTIRLPRETLDAECSVCGKEVTWTEFYGQKIELANSDHAHYYLAGDVNTDELGYTETDLINLGANQKLCLYLDGHTLTTGSRIRTYGADDSNTAVNIIAGDGGKYVFTASVANTGLYAERNAIQLIGGEYSCQFAEGKTGNLMVANRYPTLKDVTFKGTIVLGARHARVELFGTTTVDEINYNGQAGLVRLRDGWSGSAVLNIAESYTYTANNEEVTVVTLDENQVVNTALVEYASSATGDVSFADGTELVYRNGALKVKPAAYEGECPVCGDEEIEWIEFTGEEAFVVEGTEEAPVHKHFYLAEDVTETITARELIKVTNYGTVCFYLNGKTLTVDNGHFLLQSPNSNDNITLNIIAGDTGAIEYTGSQIVQQNHGHVYVYGGTYTGANGANFTSLFTRDITLEDAIISGNLVSQSNVASVTLKGATKVGEIDFATYKVNSKVTVDGSWTGSATLNILESYDVTDGEGNVTGTVTNIVNGVLSEKYTYTGTPTGQLTWNGQKLIYAENNKIELARIANCPACDENVEWIKFDGTQAFRGTYDEENKSWSGINEHMHFYLPGDVSYNGNAITVNMILIGAGGKVCFDLNGHKLTMDNARFWLSGGATDGELNIIAGDGGSVDLTATVVGTTVVDNIVQVGAGTANIYGGTFTADDATVNEEIKQRYFATVSSGTLNLYDVATEENIKTNATKGLTKLFGTTEIGTIKLDYVSSGNTLWGKLELDTTWEGSATLDMTADQLTLGAVDKNVVYYNTEKAEPAGALKLADETALVYEDGGVRTERAERTEVCSVCGGDAVTWTEFTGEALTVNNGEHLHYYLTKDIDTTVLGDAAPARIIEMVVPKKDDGGKETKLCLDLNGHKLTTGSTIYVEGNDSGYATLNLIGNAENSEYIFTADKSSVGINLAVDNLNIYGGTYTYAPAEGKTGTLISFSRQMVITNAYIDGPVKAGSRHGRIVLAGNTEVTEVIDLTTADGSAGFTLGTRAANWTGSASVNIAETCIVRQDGQNVTVDTSVDGVLNNVLFTYVGTPTGKLTVSVADGEAKEMVCRNGVIKEKPAAYEGECPVCGEVTDWVEFDGTTAYTVDNGHMHFYLADDITESINGDLIKLSSVSHVEEGKTVYDSYGSACFYLNGYTLTVNNSKFNLSNECQDYASTLNLIADEKGGEIIYSGSALVNQNYGILNVIGGTYTAEDGKNFADCLTRGVTLTDAKVGNLVSLSNVTSITLKGATETGTITFGEYNSSLKLDETWTGSATLNILASYDVTNSEGVVTGTVTNIDNGVLSEKYTYTGMPSGKLMVSVDGAEAQEMVCRNGVIKEKPAAYEEECAICKKAVEWIEFYGQEIILPEGTEDAPVHAHYYLADDVTTGEDAPENIITLGAYQDLCLDLNGCTLTTGSRILVYGNDDSYTHLNIIGNGGEYVYTASKARSGIYLQRNAMKILGGTFTYEPAEGKTGTLIVASRYPTIENATINGKVVLDTPHASLILEGTTSISDLDFYGQNAKVTIKNGWSGTATVTLPEGALVDGIISTDRIAYASGATGKVTLSTGEKTVAYNGGLAVARVATCSACGEEVTWEIFDGTKAISSNDNPTNTHVHYYLIDDVHYNGNVSSVNMAVIVAGGKLCLDLNGKDLTIDNARLWLGGTATDGVMNIFADGSTVTLTDVVTGENTITNIIQVGAGTANVYGGTFTAADGRNFATVYSGTLNLCDVTTEENIITNSWDGVTKLTGTTTVGTVKLDYISEAEDGTKRTLYGKLELVDGWSGTATVDLDDSFLVENKLPTNLVSYSGETPTGKLKLTTGQELVCQSGAVRLPLQTRTVDCPVCGEVKVWNEYDGTRMEDVTGDVHLYLTNDLTITSAATMIEVIGNANVCFDLNGKKLTTRGNITLNDGETGTTSWDEATNTSSGETEEVGVFNLIANNGSVEFTGTGNFIKHAEATVNILGGTYTANKGVNIFAVSRPMNLENVTVTGNIVLDSVRTMLTLKGNTNIDGEIIVLDDQRVHREDFMFRVDSSFTGNAVLNVPAVCMVGENENDLLLPTIEGGALQSARYISNGEFTGNLTLTNGAKLYGREGKLALGTAKIAGETTTWYSTAAEAIAAYTAEDFAAGNYLRIYGGDVALTGANYYIDNAGFDLNVTGTGKLYAMDSDNAEDFEGFGSWSVAEGIEIVRDFTIGETRYIVITENGETSAHALVIELSGLTVNTEEAGLYYDAQFKCDETLAAKIDVYGIIASLKDMPGAERGVGDARTELHTFAPDWNHAVLSDSSTVYGIFKDTRTADKNAQYGEMKIYANPYIQLDVDGDGNADVIVGDTENVGEQAGNAWSLYDALKYVNDNWNLFTGADRTAIHEFYNTWADKGMRDYADDLPNIVANTASPVAEPLQLSAIAPAEDLSTVEARREEVLSFMDKTMSFAWTPNVKTNHTNNKGDGDYDVRTYEVGKVYGGTPYVTNCQGNLYTMMEYYDTETGILDLTGGMDTIKLFANQCSGSVYWAWQRVCASAKFDATATMVPSHGCISLIDGDVIIEEKNLAEVNSFYDFGLKGERGNATATDVIIEQIGDQKLYEAYAKMQKADGLVTFIDGNNHSRMVASEPEVVTVEGKISGESTVKYIDQSGVMVTTEEQSNGVEISLIGDHYVTKTFKELMDEGYIPFTFAELQEGSEVTKSETTLDYTAGTASVAQLADATVTSNYGISDITYEIYDGETLVYRDVFVAFPTLDLHSYSFKLGYKGMMDADALEFFADGNHTVKVSARIGTGEKPVIYSGTLVG